MTSSISFLAGLVGGALALLVGGACAAALQPEAWLPVLAGELAVAAGGGIALALLVRQLRSAGVSGTAAAQEAARLRVLLSASPEPWCGWGSDGTHTVSPEFPKLLGLSRVEHLDEIETALAASDAAALHGSFQHLLVTGAPFQITVHTSAQDRVLQISGARAIKDGLFYDALWLRDVTGQAGELQRAVDSKAAAERGLGELRAALNALSLPVWLRSGDRALVWCNGPYAQATGHDTPGAAVAAQAELLDGNHGTPPRALAERAWDTGRPQTETQHVVVGTERRLLSLTEVPLASHDIMVGFAVDITRESELEGELKRHTAAHAEVLEQLGSAIAIFGPDTHLRFFNHAYAALWDLDEDWLRAEPTYGELMEELRERRKLQEEADFARWKRDQLAQFTSLLEAREDLIHLPDGRTLRTLAVPHPFGGLMFVQEDVTTALALESSYNTLMAVQQETLDNLAEGIAVFGGDGRLKLFNPSFARICKLDPAELAWEPHLVEIIEKTRKLIDPGSGWEQVRNRMVERALDRTVSSERIEFANGSVVSWQSVPLPDGAALFSLVDMTDTVRVEQALRASNEALETADRLKSEFIANVSYQLRTPLNAIVGFAEILENQYFGPLNERQREYARGVLEASGRLLSLINDILDLATIEAGFMVLDLAPVAVDTLLQTVADLTKDWAAQRDLIVSVDCPPGAGFLQADEKRLKQALFNLVSNAIKFTPPGGRITLAATRTDDAVVLSVIDTGIGIPAAEHERVFGRFERSNGQSSQHGAGLGLSLVKSFIELHGGRVEMDSAPGRGTRVDLRLPRRAADEAEAVRPRRSGGR